MTFTSPLWLAGLLPWVAVTIWLLTGRRARTEVPFLDLWKGPDAAPPRARAAFERPPLPVICAIVAMLLAILGAARPRISSGAPVDQSPEKKGPGANIRIISAAASVSPRPQVMVRVRNDSAAVRATLAITSASQELRSTIDLPPSAQEKNYFIDLQSADATISIHLASDVQDDNPADNRATLSRAHSPAIIESRGDLPPEAQRIIAAYGKTKPAGAGAERIIVTTDALPPQTPAVIMATSDQAQTTIDPHVTDHPLNAHVDWPAVMKQGGRVSSQAAPGSGWQAVLTSNDRAMVAVRESPARQVWIGFTSDAWPRTGDFVIFWTNVFDWIGQNQNGSQYVMEPNATTIPQIQPEPRAAPPSTDRDMTSVFLVVSLAILLVATMTWKTRSPVPPSSLPKEG